MIELTPLNIFLESSDPVKLKKDVLEILAKYVVRGAKFKDTADVVSSYFPGVDIQYIHELLKHMIDMGILPYFYKGARMTRRTARMAILAEGGAQGLYNFERDEYLRICRTIRMVGKPPYRKEAPYKKVMRGIIALLFSSIISCVAFLFMYFLSTDFESSFIYAGYHFVIVWATLCLYQQLIEPLIYKHENHKKG